LPKYRLSFSQISPKYNQISPKSNQFLPKFLRGDEQFPSSYGTGAEDEETADELH